MHHSIKTARYPKAGNSGFTLLELIVGIGLIGIVLTGVYKVASKSIELSENVLIRQHDNLHMHSFMGLLKKILRIFPVMPRFIWNQQSFSRVLLGQKSRS